MATGQALMATGLRTIILNLCNFLARPFLLRNSRGGCGGRGGLGLRPWQAALVEITLFEITLFEIGHLASFY